MTSGWDPPSSACNPSSWVSKCRSISDIISSLRTSFRDADYNDAETELLSREQKLRREKEEMELNWRQKYDILKGERTELRLKVCDLELERDRLLREGKINDVKLADLADDLKAAKEGERRANVRYGDMLKELEAMDRKKEELLQCEKSAYSETLRDFRNEVEDLRRKVREKDEKIDGLLRKKKNELFEIAKREEEAMAQVEELRKQNEALVRIKAESDSEKEQLLQLWNEMQSKVDELKRKNDAHLEEVKRISREKNEVIDELVNKNENLEIEKLDKLREIEGLRAEKRQLEDQMEKQVSELESCVATWMMSNVPNDKSLGNTQVGKILSGFIKFLDSKETGVDLDSNVEKGGNLVDGDLGVDTCTNQPAQVAGALGFEHEVSAETGAEKGVPPMIGIIEIDSGSDDETRHRREVKRNSLKRKHIVVSTSSDDSLNATPQVKKLNDLPQESVKRELCTPKSHSVSTVRKCNDKLREEGNIQANDRTAVSVFDKVCSLSPGAKELIDTCTRSKGNKCQ